MNASTLWTPCQIVIRGTPEETERINLLDGIIVELTREARRAARAASSETGNKAIAAEFELNFLYPTKTKEGDPP